MSQHIIADMYSKGTGVKQDLFEAITWYTCTIEQARKHDEFKQLFDMGIEHQFFGAVRKQMAEAQYKIAQMYTTGQGVPQDNVVAYMWFNLSALQGNELAKEYRDTVATKMTSTQIKEAQQLVKEWNLKKANQNCN